MQQLGGVNQESFEAVVRSQLGPSEFMLSHEINHSQWPTVMRAPGESPGMFALESAMDELAAACGVDPVELRLRNEPELDPETGLPYSTRNLAACLREGMRRFGWQHRDPAQDCGQRTAGWPGPAPPPPPTRYIPTRAVPGHASARSPVAGTGWRSGPPTSAPGRGPC